MVICGKRVELDRVGESLCEMDCNSGARSGAYVYRLS